MTELGYEVGWGSVVSSGSTGNKVGWPIYSMVEEEEGKDVWGIVPGPAWAGIWPG